MPRGSGNSIGLRRFEGNRPLAEQLTADRLNMILDFIEMGIIRFPAGGAVYGSRMLGGTTINVKFPPPPVIPVPSFNWKMTKVIKEDSAYIQINGGDGFSAALNGRVATIDGNPVDTKIGSPPAYPLLPVTDNGFVYATATPTTPGHASPLDDLPVEFATTLPGQDTANPAEFYILAIGTISNYRLVDGKPDFDVNNFSNYGWTSLVYCLGVFQVY